MKRLMALSLGIAFPVETHLYFDGVAIVSHYSFNSFSFHSWYARMKRQKISWDAIYIMAWLNWDLKPMARAISKWPGVKILGYPRRYHIVALYIRLSRLAIVFDSIKLFPSHLPAIILGVSSIQKTYLTRLTCPRPFLFLPWLRLLTVMIQLFSVICNDARRILWVLCFISFHCFAALHHDTLVFLAQNTFWHSTYSWSLHSIKINTTNSINPITGHVG